jgi:4-hydroxybenzoate polyprenyltransferase
MNRAKLLAYAQLLRLPNVFTAFADIAMAGCAAGYILDRPGVFALLLAASGCLYLGGMVFNDYFDRHADAKTQAFRPIPSGRIDKNAALVVGVTLLVFGCALGTSARGPFVRNESTAGISPLSQSIPVLLAATILLYDGWLKRTPAGPIGMGACRFLNVLLGLSGAGDEVFTSSGVHLAAVVGVYIVGVTWFARTEEGESNRRQLAYAALVMLAALGLAVTVPAHLPAGTAPVYFPYLVAAFGFYIGSAVVHAIRNPGSKEVQAAVKRCILGLVVLDAVLATAFVGAWGLLLLLLLLPARWLGQWVYST